MSVHSKQLGKSTSIGTSLVVLYTVPTGRRTIVKSVAVINTNGAAQRITMKFAGVYQTMHLAAATAAGESQEFQCWIVLNAGETLEISTGAATAYAIASGAELIL